MDKKNKISKFIWILSGIAILAILSVIYIQYQRGWFTEIIPSNCSGTTWGDRKWGEIFNPDQVCRDGEWEDETGWYVTESKGMIIHNTLDVTITHGTLKVELYDIGMVDEWSQATEIVKYHLDDCERIYEKELKQSDVYEIDFSDLNPEHVYWASVWVAKDGNNEYRYEWTITSSAPRWYRLHDKWLAWLPFVDEKWDTCPKW